jgi:hypothetical protein
MNKMLATCAALAVATVLALPDTAAAAQRPDGFRNSDLIEVSAARRHRRVYRYRHWGPPPPYYYRPYYRPYYYGPAPWPFPFFGPFWW